MADSSKLVTSVLDSYHRARYKFVSNIVDLANDPKNAEVLYSMGIMSLLQPLVQDCIASVQYAAMVAVGRLATVNELCAKSVVQDNFLPQLCRSLSCSNKHDRRAAAYALMSIAQYEEFAPNLADSSTLPALAERLMDGSPAVKEASACALAQIARNGRDLAQQVIETGAVGLLALSLQDSNIRVRKASITALAEVATHGELEAKVVADSGALNTLGLLLQAKDCQLNSHACFLVGSVTKHNAGLSEVVLASNDVFLSTMTSCLRSTDANLRFSVANSLHRIARQSRRLANYIVKADCVYPMIDYVKDIEIRRKLPGVLCLGYFGGCSSEIAEKIIINDGAKPLLHILRNKCEDRLKGASIWALNRLGSHSANHAKLMAEEGVLMTLSEACSAKSSFPLNDQLKTEAISVQLQLLDHLSCIDSLTILLRSKHLCEEVLECLLRRLLEVLSMDEAARVAFKTNGGLKRLHELHNSPYAKHHSSPREDELVVLNIPRATLERYIDAINMNFPFEMSTAYEAEYSECLLNNLHEIASIMVPATGGGHE